MLLSFVGYIFFNVFNLFRFFGFSYILLKWSFVRMSVWVVSLFVPSKNGRECQKTERRGRCVVEFPLKRGEVGGGSAICVSTQISRPFQLIIRLRWAIRVVWSWTSLIIYAVGVTRRYQLRICGYAAMGLTENFRFYTKIRVDVKFPRVVGMIVEFVFISLINQ